MLGTELRDIGKGLRSKQKHSHKAHPPTGAWTNFQAVGQVISSAGLSGPLTQRPLPS